MTHGAIDLKIAAERLEIVRTALLDLRGLHCGSLAEFTSDRRNSWLADALLRHAIEALFDTAPHILAKVHSRGGLECRDVARLAIEHRLVSGGELADRLVKIAGVRNPLIHHYDAVTLAELFTVLQCHLSDLEHLADELQQSAASLCRRSRHRLVRPRDFAEIPPESALARF
jgi:uncharacterized protein YutE (UPF0331/DUF86 family)